jgi:hypothetical protein
MDMRFISASDRVGGFGLFDELHIDQCAAQESLGHFARSNSTHPRSPVGIDSQGPSDILHVFHSEKH